MHFYKTNHYDLTYTFSYLFFSLYLHNTCDY